MSDQGGGDRPRWEGFPGGVDPDQYAAGPGGTGYQPPGPERAGPPDQPHPTQPVPGLPGDPQQPAPPQFPVHPAEEFDTGPVPVVGATPIDPAPVAEAGALGPRQAARSHSAPKPHTSRYVSIACAVAVVLVGAGFGFVACNNDDVSTSGNAPVVPLTSPTTASVLPSSSAIPTRTASATPSRSATRSASPSATASKSATASAGASPSATAKAVKQPVVVLNSTAITGLAKRVAAQITAGGWTVTKTTNWKGTAPRVSTIYYAPGAKNKASAILFKNKFDVAVVARPALPGMSGPLTLVLTRDAA